MGLHSELPVGLGEVDIIIAGGGTASCVVVARLSDVDPSLSILVLEAGPNNHNAPEVVHLGLYRANFAPDSPNFQYWPAVEEKQLVGRAIALMTGSMLGGGSPVNGAIYARAQHREFDEWNTKGWSGDDLLPFMKKVREFILVVSVYTEAGGQKAVCPPPTLVQLVPSSPFVSRHATSTAS